MHRPPLDLRELLVVRVIASEGSIHGAARMLGGKQSAISRSLRLLEERLGVHLFRRTSSGAKLTPAGAAFLKEANDLLDGTARLYEHTRRWSVGENGVVSVGLQGSLPPGRVSDMLEPYRMTEPGISFAWQDATRQDLLQALKEGAIDLAVMTLPLPGAGVASVPLWSDRVVAVMSVEHPIAQSGTASWAELHGATFLIGKDDIGLELGALLERKMRQAGYAPRIQPEAMRSLRVIAVVANGESIALLPDAWLAFLPSSIRERIAVVEVVDGDGFPHFAYGAAWQRETCPPAARKVIRFLEQQATAF
ncbi:LysR family transcriptional regulator [Novacetimonas pomaceti]|uniref:LysR family transcriptional regulator n=1 Tax=Novacetimonas pomaceti TaxID=2021998 RepID=A0ABX5P4D3_9PROT|nr:LysR family transcriptional regulator [Novacetimonas pomaceti]PYD48640.1 LysR family transcriptional regulator [Novacetimonas pomaceti]